jgi:hypothetical protein
MGRKYVPKWLQEIFHRESQLVVTVGMDQVKATVNLVLAFVDIQD